MAVSEQRARADSDEFEARVTAHKIAIARVIRLEDQLISLMRERGGTAQPEITGRYFGAFAEARDLVWSTGRDLFAPAAAAPPRPDDAGSTPDPVL